MGRASQCEQAFAVGFYATLSILSCSLLRDLLLYVFVYLLLLLVISVFRWRLFDPYFAFQLRLPTLRTPRVVAWNKVRNLWAFCTAATWCKYHPLGLLACSAKHPVMKISNETKKKGSHCKLRCLSVCLRVLAYSLSQKCVEHCMLGLRNCPSVFFSCLEGYVTKKFQWLQTLQVITNVIPLSVQTEMYYCTSCYSNKFVFGIMSIISDSETSKREA